MTEGVTGAVGRVLAAELRLLDGSGMVSPVGDWHVHEKRQGWVGFAVVSPGAAEDLDAESAFMRTTAYGLAPDRPVALELKGKSLTESDAPDDFIRGWPSVITKVDAGVPADGDITDFRVMVLFSDPLSYLFRNPIWGVFKDRSPGELLAGALMLASGVKGAPSLEPVIEGLPSITITESVREEASEVPYAIAAGEPLGWWLGALFGRLGIRMELLGAQAGGVALTLADGEPAGSPVNLGLGAGQPSADHAVISHFVQSAVAPERDTMVDNASLGQPKTIGEERPVGRLLTSAGIDLDEATVRSKLVRDGAMMEQSALRIVSGQPGLHSGRLVSFDRPVTGASQWQVDEVWHGAAEGAYRNEASLVKLGTWVPAPPAEKGMAVVSGVVHELGLEVGEPVERDALGRIPIRFPFSQGIGSPEGDETAPASAEALGPGIMLPVAAPMAGGTHGFVPSHRQGDVCRVAVHHLMLIEVIGFGFADHRRVGDDLVDVSMGVVVDHGRGRWTGMVFRPGEEVEAEEKEQSEAWRTGKG